MYSHTTAGCTTKQQLAMLERAAPSETNFGACCPLLPLRAAATAFATPEPYSLNRFSALHSRFSLQFSQPRPLKAIAASVRLGRCS